MKLIDQTPFRSKDGTISPMDRIQATLKYGFSWYNDLQSQDRLAAILNRTLERNYVLMQNIKLPGTEVTLPFVLIGPPGVFLINITFERGVYRAKGEEWGSVSADRFVPASVNMLTRTARLAGGMQKFLDKQGFKDMLKVEGVLLAANPGMHVDSVRPVVRVVLSDALERFAASMAQARPMLNAPVIQNIAERILEPVTPKKDEAKSAAGGGTPVVDVHDASKSETDTWNPDQYRVGGFNEDASATEENTPAAESSAPQQKRITQQMRAPARPSGQPAKKQPAKKARGLSRNQIIILAVVALLWICGMIAVVYFLL